MDNNFVDEDDGIKSDMKDMIDSLNNTISLINKCRSIECVGNDGIPFTVETRKTFTTTCDGLYLSDSAIDHVYNKTVSLNVTKKTVIDTNKMIDIVCVRQKFINGLHYKSIKHGDIYLENGVLFT